MLIKARKSIYLKVTRNSIRLPWPDIAVHNDANGIHVYRAFTDISRHKRVYLFRPHATGYFYVEAWPIGLPNPTSYSFTHLVGFPEKLAKALFAGRHVYGKDGYWRPQKKSQAHPQNLV